MGSKARQSQDTTQTTTQVDRRVGASDQAVVATEGSQVGNTLTEIQAGRDLTVTSLDPETIAGAFGLTEEVAGQLAALAGQTVQGGQNLAERLSGQTTAVVERLSSGYGAQLSDLATTKATGGANQTNKLVMVFIVVAGIVVGIIFWRRS